MKYPAIAYDAIIVADNGAVFMLNFRGDNNELAEDHLRHVVFSLEVKDFTIPPRGTLTVFWKRSSALNYHQFKPTRYWNRPTQFASSPMASS